MRKRIDLKWIVFVLFILFFSFITICVFDDGNFKLDKIVYDFMSEHFIKDEVTDIVKIITNFGGVAFLLIVTLISVVMIKNKAIKICIAFNLLFSSGINFLIKNILQRPRPEGFRLIEENGYSFPSGHSMVSMSFYGLFIYFIHKYIGNKKLKVFLISVLSFIIFLVGTSRIYLGVHYTSDVLAGYSIAIIYLIIFTTIAKKFILKRDDNMKTEIKKLINSFKYAFEGIYSALKYERNMKLHFIFMILVIGFGIFLKISLIEWMICIMLFGIVIGGELFNTAIETIVDMVMSDQNDKAKLAKDVSAGAVLVMAISSAIIGLIIFIPKIMQLIRISLT